MATTTLRFTDEFPCDIRGFKKSLKSKELTILSDFNNKSIILRCINNLYRDILKYYLHKGVDMSHMLGYFIGHDLVDLVYLIASEIPSWNPNEPIQHNGRRVTPMMRAIETDAFGVIDWLQLQGVRVPILEIAKSMSIDHIVQHALVTGYELSEELFDTIVEHNHTVLDWLVRTFIPSDSNHANRIKEMLEHGNKLMMLVKNRMEKFADTYVYTHRIRTLESLYKLFNVLNIEKQWELLPLPLVLSALDKAIECGHMGIVRFLAGYKVGDVDVKDYLIAARDKCTDEYTREKLDKIIS